MDFFKLIQSLDELVYEVLSWLLFYPRTLWTLLRRPVQTMVAVEAELAEDKATQFDDQIGPPLFLALTLTLIHVAELQLVGQAREVTSQEGFYRFIANDTNLLILRIILFGLLPLTAARRLLRRRGERLEKQALRAPFYAQCYAASVYALILNAGYFVASAKGIAQPTAWGLALIGVGVGWFLAVEAAWFRAKGVGGWIAGAWNAVVVLGQWLGLLILTGIVLR